MRCMDIGSLHDTCPDIVVEQSTLDRYNTEVLRLINKVQSFLQSIMVERWTVRSSLSNGSIRAASQFAINLIYNLKTTECFYANRWLRFQVLYLFMRNVVLNFMREFNVNVDCIIRHFPNSVCSNRIKLYLFKRPDTRKWPT